MYNLPTLQRQHPQLRQLNNWTGQHGGLFDGLEQRESNSTSNSYTEVTAVDLGDGRPGHLQGRALPPLVETDFVKNISKENISDVNSTLTPVFAKVSPLSALPPLKIAGKREDAHDVIDQATKHIQDYKDDVRRIDECLQIAKQQQSDSLLEKMKERQILKQAEIEEKKQRDALHTKIMRFEAKEKKKKNAKNENDKNEIVKGRKKARNDVEYDDVYDIKHDVANNVKYNVDEKLKRSTDEAEYDKVYDMKHDVIHDVKNDVINKEARDDINGAEYDDVYDITRGVVNEVKKDVINKGARDDIKGAEYDKVYKIKNDTINVVKFDVNKNAKDDIIETEHDKVRKIKHDLTNTVKHEINDEARYDTNQEETAGNQYDSNTASTTCLYNKKEEPAQIFSNTHFTDVNHALGQRQDSIQWIKVEGKRKKSLKKLIKFAVVFLVIVLFGILLIAIKKSRPITDEVARNESIGGTGSVGSQHGNNTEEQDEAVKVASPSLPWSSVASMDETEALPTTIHYSTATLESTDWSAADETTALSSRTITTSFPIVTSTQIYSFGVTQQSMSRTPSPQKIPISASVKRSMSHTPLVQSLSPSVKSMMSHSPLMQPLPIESSMSHTPLVQSSSSSVKSMMSHSPLMQPLSKESPMSHTISIKPVPSSVTQHAMMSRYPSILESKTLPSISIHEASSSTKPISTAVVYTTRPSPGESLATPRSVTSISQTSLSLSSTSSWTYEVDETVTDAEYVCSVTSTTTDVDALWRKIKKLSNKIHRMLLHRYYYYHLIRAGYYRRRGKKLLDKVCDLIQHPGNGGMVLIDLQTMAQRLMDLLEITYSCV